jgi:hypothetical protein
MSDRIGIISHGRITDVRPAGAVSKTDLVKAAGLASAGETEKAA